MISAASWNARNRPQHPLTEDLAEWARHLADDIRADGVWLERAASQSLVVKTLDDCAAEVARLNRMLTRCMDAREQIIAERDRYREALERADHVLARIIAPCPQCHTLGRSFDCPVVVHRLPEEARQDIREVRSNVRAALAQEDNSE